METTPPAPSVVRRPKTILEAFETIVEKAEGSNLSPEFFASVAVPVGYAKRRLKLSALQTVLLALFVDRSEFVKIHASEIAKYCGCRTTRLLGLYKDIDVLEGRHYLRARRGEESLSYRVPHAVLGALKENKAYQYQPEPVCCTGDFFSIFSRYLRNMQRGEMNHNQVVESAKECIGQITGSHFVRHMKRLFNDFNDEEMWLFIFMAHLFIENRDDQIGFGDIEEFYDNDRIPSYIRSALRARVSRLFDLNLIENANDNGIANSSEFKITDFAKKEVLSELDLILTPRRNTGGLTAHDSFPAKELYFNQTEEKQTEELAAILMPDKFAAVQARLAEAGMRKGFCCLFYGDPGTGKTESVYQIARRTGRDIYRVDVDKIKSCWVGESEKNIKGLFDRYRTLCRESDLLPILLFNEADAVLGVRTDAARGGVEKMENSIQNIILQEMETLEGIMIATTNLTSNLDKAFERRFLYKIRYVRPSAATRAKIWRSMMKGLSREQAQSLADSFDLSGGEIENIVRKHTVDAILAGGEIIDLERIAQVCRAERIVARHSARVGFAGE